MVDMRTFKFEKSWFQRNPRTQLLLLFYKKERSHHDEDSGVSDVLWCCPLVAGKSQYSGNWQ
jgi:hypothetical protein